LFKHVPRLLKLAGPMILSTSAITCMQIIDAIVLSRHSSQAVAAIGPSGMAVILFQGFLFGTAGYAGTFVAHNHGRGDAQGVRSAAWLGIYAALFSGVVALAVAWPIAGLFQLAGHEPLVARDEYTYFLICMAGSFFPVLGAAWSGWLSGIGRPAISTGVTFVSFVVNALLAWGLVLGEWGMPRMGIAGAALATVAAQAVAALLYGLLFARAGGFADAVARRFDWPEFRRFLSLAMPMGLRISGELAAWTLFLVVVGRLGTVELAASSIAFRINGLAFFPALGLGQAAGILVGHARGAGKDDEIPGIAWQSLAVCEVWMLLMATLFATASRWPCPWGCASAVSWRPGPCFWWWSAVWAPWSWRHPASPSASTAWPFSRPWGWDRPPASWWGMPEEPERMTRFRESPGSRWRSARSGCY